MWLGAMVDHFRDFGYHLVAEVFLKLAGTRFVEAKCPQHLGVVDGPSSAM